MWLRRFVSILSIFAAGAISYKNDPTIQEYENLINQQFHSSIRFKFPENAFEFKPTKNRTRIYGTFDFIIVGAGATGSVIANRLSQIETWKILLLEAGSFGNEATAIPNMVSSIGLSDYNWGYTSTPQTTACLDMPGRRCAYPRGKGVGGSTLINGLIYSRGSRLDYDKWAEENPGWSYNEVIAHFKKMENYEHTDSGAVTDYEYHGTGGDLNVAYQVPRQPLVDTFLEANREKGYQIIDCNGREAIGACMVPLNIKHGRRDDTGTAFIKPILNRTNLEVSTNSFVTKIIIKQKRVVGVRFVRNGQTYVARASKEVILSAGAIASPQLLMLSGVGPAKHLQQLGIEVVENLEVGTTLRDHPMFYGLHFDSNQSKASKSLSECVEEYLKGMGSLTAPNNIAALGFYQTKFENQPNYSDLEIIMLTADGFLDNLQKRLAENSAAKYWLHLDNIKSFALYVIGLHSKSVGTVRLKSANPFEYPTIDSRFLSDKNNEDIGTLYEGIKLVLDLAGTKAFEQINATLVRHNLPACDNETYLSESYWYCVLRYFTGNVYHPMGTCPMGPDRNRAVVDAKTKVYGIKNLRVADASIFPFTFSGHPSALCSMVGEKVSDMIKLEYFK